ncbi:MULTISPECIES: FAD:protein FMN transferase [Massilia]|uniref:FAD:protein FMN transferase n=1 Tax=Massilia orientalis TaxID=3050128 RepID=A0ACC7MHJ5_9BURK|nr:MULTISPECIES: FAD:protein FMN transferase [unclassified Massilia]
MKTFSEQQSHVALRRYSLNGKTMGTRYTAIFYASEPIDAMAIGARLQAAVDKVDLQMSTWIPTSDVCRLNAAPENTWVTIPFELMEVLDIGLRVGQASHGAFDMGVGALVDVWGFGPSARSFAAHDPAPDPRRPTQAGAILDTDRARRRVRKLHPVTLDLSGIAKGYGVDELARCLERLGVERYLVGIDGEMRARGVKPGGEAWAVAVEKPVFGQREVSGVMELVDAAIATSGDYRHWIEVDGKRYAHTMDPRSGQPLSNAVAAVTVLMPTCVLADAWATALLVLGEQDGVVLARANGIDAIFVLREDDRLREILVPGRLLQ